MKIIIVDDDKIIRMGLAKKINRLIGNHEIESNFQNGQVALEYLQNNIDVDLVITDIKMPIMTGIELIKAAKKLKKAPLFVVLSGYDDFSYVRDSMKVGAFNYLLKPIKEEELINVITEAENNIKYLRKKEKLLDSSIKILRRDLFKYILFSKETIEADSKVLTNLSLSEDYIYKMIVFDDIEKEYITEIIAHIKGINKLIETVVFQHEYKIYIIIYFKEKDIDKNKIEAEIDKIAKKLVYIDKNIYIFEDIDYIWSLREQSNLITKISKCNESKVAKKYHLKDNTIIDELEENKASTGVRAVEQAKIYIKENFNRNITLREVSDEVYLSQNYFSELFKKEIGEGFYEYLSKYRIKRAKEMLLNSNMKIYEIANRVGYKDSITFCRVFKKITGTTPNNYRNDKIKIN